MLPLIFASICSDTPQGQFYRDTTFLIIPKQQQQPNDWKSPAWGAVIYPCSKCGVVGDPVYICVSLTGYVPCSVPSPKGYFYDLKHILWTIGLPQFWLDRKCKYGIENVNHQLTVMLVPLVLFVTTHQFCFHASNSAADSLYSLQRPTILIIDNGAIILFIVPRWKK